MKNTEIINYLEELNTAQTKGLESVTNKEEQLALLMALHVKKLELLELFEVKDDKQESFGKVKESLLDSISEMIQSL